MGEYSFIADGCSHRLLIPTLWRFNRDSMPYVKSSSRWVTGVLARTWPTCGRKVGLTIHLTASAPKVLYCWFMTALVGFFPLNFLSNLVVDKAISTQGPLTCLFWWLSPFPTALVSTWSSLSRHAAAAVQTVGVYSNVEFKHRQLKQTSSAHEECLIWSKAPENKCPNLEWGLFWVQV